MSLLGVDLAIFERLVGAPLDKDGRPQTDSKGIPINRLIVPPPLTLAAEEGERWPSYGVRIPELTRTRDTKRTFSTKNSKNVNLNDFSTKAWRNVPVFGESIDGADYQDIWPVVTFYWMDEQFNSSIYMYADPIREDDRTSPTMQIVDVDGNVLHSGPARYKLRAHPEPVDLIYAIRVWSKDMVELRALCEAVKRLFPARGVLEVEQWNGSKVPYDMLQESAENFDYGGLNVSESEEGEQHGFSRAFVYRIEAYQDNTIDSQAVWAEDTVRVRVLELAQMQETLATSQLMDRLEVEEVSYQGGIRVQVQKP